MQMLSERRREFEEMLQEFFEEDRKAKEGETVNAETLERFAYSVFITVGNKDGLSWPELFESIRRKRKRAKDEPIDVIALLEGR